MTRSNHPFLASLALAAALVASGCGPADPQEALAEGAQSSGGGGGAIRSFTLSSASAAAGDTITGTVVLDGSSSGSAIVYVGFRSSLLAGPKFIRIPSGRSSGTFTLHVNPAVAAPASVSITASTSTPQPATFFAQTLSIAASATPPLPQVVSVTLSPSAVTTGTSSTGTVTLAAPAPAGGAVVQLGNPNDFFNLDADVPAVVVVPAGAASATFTVNAHLSSAALGWAQDTIVANVFGGPFQGAALTVTR